MSLGAVLDVAIGLAFTYLLLGLIASAVQELFAGLLQLRGRALRSQLFDLLAGNDPKGQPVKLLFDQVYGHALIEDLSKRKLPSYVPARNFAMALLDTLKGASDRPLFSAIEARVANLPAGTAKEALASFITRAAGDVDALQKSVETWFDDAMDRLSGSYKRFSTYFTLGFGLVVAIAFNVDTITLTKTLWNDPTVRATLATAAQRYVDANPDPAKPPQADAIAAQLRAMPPIGWTAPNIPRATASSASGANDESGRSVWAVLRATVCAPDWSGAWTVIGWLITAIAVSLGAPFWFNALGSLLKLRNTGPKPARSDQATPKSDQTR
jgi:hypothetical protein